MINWHIDTKYLLKYHFNIHNSKNKNKNLQSLGLIRHDLKIINKGDCLCGQLTI